MYDAPWKLALGLITGVVFGFLLQKGQVAKYSAIVGQLLLRDWTVLKVMGTAIAVGSFGVYALVALNVTPLEIKPMQLGGVLAGAACFGVGMAVLGYCPGTTVAAMGEGRADAFAGIAGMMAGAWLFVASYPLAARVQGAFGDMGKITWPALTGTAAWPWVGAVGFAAACAYFVQRRRTRLVEAPR